MDDRLAATGAELPPQWALQDPADYIEALRSAVPEAVRAAGVAADEVVGIGTDFTSSTPMPVLADGTPLCVPGFEDRPHAYVKLWKHHAAQRQADRERGRGARRAWLARYGGRISSEWEFAKAPPGARGGPEVYERMDRWLEAADWIVWQLCGRETRSICTAGYKAIHQDGATPRRTTCASSTRASSTSSRRSRGRRCRGRGRRPDRPGGEWTGLPRASRWRSGTSTRTSRHPRRGPIDPVSCS